MAGQSKAAREAYLRRTDLVASTDRTLTEPAALHAAFDRVAEEGYALIDQELELGLRSIAVPVVKDGVTVAAINVGVPADRVRVPELRSRYLPVLRRAALARYAWPCLKMSEPPALAAGQEGLLWNSHLDGEARNQEQLGGGVELQRLDPLLDVLAVLPALDHFGVCLLGGLFKVGTTFATFRRSASGSMPDAASFFAAAASRRAV